MSICGHIKGVTYSPIVVKIIKSLHLRAPMRALYYYFTKPKNNIRNIPFCGINAQFYTPTPLELRMVETPFSASMGDERKTLEKLLGEISEGDVVYDIGANIGVQTVFMAKKTGAAGKVIAIEPESVSFHSLCMNIELNGLKNVLPIQVALGKEIKESQLYSNKATGDCSLVNNLKAAPLQETSIIPGDDLVRKRNLPLPNIVEIDVEGYEYYVIEGLKDALSQDKCRVVFCEIHPLFLPRDINAEQCIELLKSYGFGRVEVYTRGDTLHAFFTRINNKNEN